MYQNINAWREILARTFAGFSEQDNVSPEWLVNPATRRRLKLDKYYPEAGIAIRFLGLMAKGQGRLSDEEAWETEQRDQTRAELCRLHGVQLFLLDPMEDAVKLLDGLVRTLSRASRTLAQSDHPPAYKQRWMPALSLARERATAVRERVAKDPVQMMNTLSEGWRDREANLAGRAAEPTPTSPVTTSYSTGQRVRHERFGEGVIIEVRGEGSEQTLTILFDATQERTFLLSLVHDKLTPV
jgi:hypothetical protein